MIDHLIKLVRACFSQIPDHRRSSGSTTYKLADLLSAGFAVFSLKDPSLLAFRQQYPTRQANLERVYGIEVVPGDTALREGLDGVLPAHLQDCFGAPLEELRHQGVFQKRLVLGEYLAVSIDGTGHYCSGTHSCPHCLVKKHRGGKESFYHQLLAAVQVHPEQSTVLPLVGEAIVNGDGAKKNDCELNAAKRLIPQLRRTMPHGTHQDIPVNYLEYTETDSETAQVLYHNSWITDLPIDQDNVQEMAAVGRSRWKIENSLPRTRRVGETFNTLKNQGYHLEHNYGHGKQLVV